MSEADTLQFNDPNFEVGKRKLSYDTLEKYGVYLRETSKCRVDGWTGKRLSPDLFPLKSVQPLFNFARESIGAIQMMKKKCVEGGIAYYNEEGEFCWREKQ
jgi:hypothetical protein